MQDRSLSTPEAAEQLPADWIAEGELQRLYDAALASIEGDLGRKLTVAERVELDRPSGLSGADTAEAIDWAFHHGGRDAVEALLGGDMPAQRLRGAPVSACRVHADGRRIAHVISGARLRGPLTRAPRRSCSSSGRPRAQASRSCARLDRGDDPPEPPRPGWRWVHPYGWAGYLAAIEPGTFEQQRQRIGGAR